MDTTTPVVASSQITGPVKLFSQAWSLFRSDWKTLVPIAIVPSVTTYVGSIFSSVGHNIFFSLIAFILTVGGIILSIASVPALIRSIHAVSTGATTDLSIKTVYRSGFSLFWSVVLVGLIGILVILGSTALFIVPGIIVGVYVGFYMYALSLDGKKGFSAFIESYQLVRGRWMAVFGRALFLGLVFLIIWMIIGAIVAAVTTGDHGSGAKLIGGLINVIAGGVMTPIAVAYSYGMYMSLKSVRQPDAPTAFKKWLVAFVCVGVLAAVSIPAIGVAVFVGSHSTISDIQIGLQQNLPR